MIANGYIFISNFCHNQVCPSDSLHRCLTETTTDPALERSGDLHRRLDSLAEKHMLLILGQALGLPRGQAADFLGVSAADIAAGLSAVHAAGNYEIGRASCRERV